MKIVRGREEKVDFEDLKNGETFRVPDETQIRIKTEEGWGCCLEDGTTKTFEAEDDVIRVACEVRVL